MPKAQTVIRPRAADDDAAIAAVVAAAFGGKKEVALIAALRRDGDMICEYVAVDPSRALVGHVAFSRLDVRAGTETLRAIALAPLAVAPQRQRQGVGDALARAALVRLRDEGEELAVVLGHPAYYTRFGFSNLMAKLLEASYSGTSFMALELKPGALKARRWRVAYPRAFAD